ncbi:hypothetical protein RHMOL_Rhmol13G0187300 [Rhododendron molle]|uniref:Uncharacterized protein n=1 Tax=Rhododendron molle TaxID=49168 RepID=A0ACC0L9P3_RHOML|nr:hypothetical protein RHMOL_Rhmol13G0187300 [Rhododendron molle]
MIPVRDRVSGYTPKVLLFWRTDLNSFMMFVCRQAVVPEVSTTRVRDNSVWAITDVRTIDWHGPHSQWAVIDAVPLSRAFPARPSSPPQVALRRASARVARGRTQPPALAEPSRPSSSQAPAAGEAHRLKCLRTQRERDASTFVAFKPEAVVAAEAAEQAVGGVKVEAEVDVPDTRPK